MSQAVAVAPEGSTAAVGARAEQEWRATPPAAGPRPADADAEALIEEGACGKDGWTTTSSNGVGAGVLLSGRRWRREWGAWPAAAAEPYRIGLTRDDAPSYVTYPFVLRGYRTGGTYGRCLAALFEPHPETLNAWTMFAGSAAAIALLVYALSQLEAAAAAATAQTAADLQPQHWWQRGLSGGGGGGLLPDAVPFVLLTVSTLVHCPFSVGFHLFRGMSPVVYNLWRRLDQLAIFEVSQLVTLSVAWFVYDRWWPLALNMAAAVAAAQLGAASVWRLRPNERRGRVRLVLIVSTVAACYLAPMVVQASSDVAALLRARRAAAAAGTAVVSSPSMAATGYAAGAAGALLVGAILFATSLPERAAPGWFDVFGFSHQWMHVSVVAAFVFEYLFVLETWRRRHGLA